MIYFEGENQIIGEDNSEALPYYELKEVIIENENLKKDIKQLKGVIRKLEKEVVELKQIIKMLE